MIAESALSSGIVEVLLGVLALLGSAFAAWLGYLTQRNIQATERMHLSISASARETDSKMQVLAAVAKDTHTLVNSNMSVALNVNRITTRRLAEMPNATADDHVAAKMAEDAFQEHQRKQQIVDSGVATEFGAGTSAGQPIPATST